MTRRLPWALFGVWVLMAATASTLQLLGDDRFDGGLAPGFVVLATVGALIAARRPGNPVGWILLALALFVTGSIDADGVYKSFENDASPPGAVRLLAWFSEWVIYVWFGLVGILLPLLFPDGRLPSRRWRPLLWVGAGVVGVSIAGTAFGSGGISWGNGGSIPNPLGIGGPVGDALSAVASVSNAAYAAVVLCALAAPALRLRRATGVERQQLKWFALAISLLIVGLASAAIGEVTGFQALGNVGWSLFIGSLVLGVPLAIAVAILRHRLLDVDVVINRTLVYGALTATLALAYLASVLVLQLVLAPLTADSSLAIAASTLAVAALFRPARARIQALVDRRFYRHRYDAARTLEAFGGRLRDELDLEALALDLRGVVDQTMQPAHVSLWLRRTS
ncbi:MAG: hypothetical protein QOC68_3129 [Solirubrobacteraceae bacterium]|jgi:hypothetical protein|nr:hypothetical protein [Solirubrobacteraceae bacterium]